MARILAVLLNISGRSEPGFILGKLTGAIPWDLSFRDCQMADIALEKAKQLNIPLPMLEQQDSLTTQQKLGLIRFAAGLGELLTSDSRKQREQTFLTMFKQVMATAFGSPGGMKQLHRRYATTGSKPARKNAQGGRASTGSGNRETAKRISLPAPVFTSFTSSQPSEAPTPQQQSRATRLVNEFAAGVFSGDIKWDMSRLMEGNLPALYEAGKKKVDKAGLPAPLATVCLDRLVLAIYNKLAHAVLGERSGNKFSIPLKTVDDIIKGIHLISARYGGAVQLYGIPMNEAGFSDLARRLWQDAIDGEIQAARSRSPFRAVIFDRLGMPQPVTRVEKNGPGLAFERSDGAPGRFHIETLTLYTRDGGAWFGYGNPQARPPRIYPIPGGRQELVPPGGDTRNVAWMRRLSAHVMAQRDGGALAEDAFIPLRGQGLSFPQGGSQEFKPAQPLQRPPANPAGGSGSIEEVAQKYGVTAHNVRRLMNATGMTAEQAASYLAAQVLFSGGGSRADRRNARNQTPGNTITAIEAYASDQLNNAILEEIRRASYEVLKSWLSEVNVDELPWPIQQALRDNRNFGSVIDKRLRNIAAALAHSRPLDQAVDGPIEKKENLFPIDVRSSIRFVSMEAANTEPSNPYGKFYGEILFAPTAKYSETKDLPQVIHGLVHEFGFDKPGHDLIHLGSGIGVDPKLVLPGTAAGVDSTTSLNPSNKPSATSEDQPANFNGLLIEAMGFGLAAQLQEEAGSFVRSVYDALPVKDQELDRLLDGRSKQEEQQVKLQLKVNVDSAFADLWQRTGYFVEFNGLVDGTDYWRQAKNLADNGPEKIEPDARQPGTYTYYMPSNIIYAFKLAFKELLATNPHFRKELRANFVRYLDFVSKLKVMYDNGIAPRRTSIDLSLSGDSTRAMLATVIGGLEQVKRLYPGMTSVDELIRHYQTIIKKGDDKSRANVDAPRFR
ncbi:hypothetical protein SAMN06265795_11951 [Noviherbaspirillum humi]|uniref:Uncharacterized protein n=1 Tax=Noviherbaspirillum humi TaxID=1688639 RepID=A0A239L4H5_9BURK|nr:hypothetical protein SAMN06265795_11951 [Noviherbaspirillum humi]